MARKNFRTRMAIARIKKYSPFHKKIIALSVLNSPKFSNPARFNAAITQDN